MRDARLPILLLVVALTGAFAPTVHHPPRPPRRLALLIGISDYKNFQPDGPPGQSDLNGPANDVPRIKTSLRRYGFDGDSSVRVLLNAQASRQGITDGFKWLAQQATDTADVVVIFYSGHGSFTKDLNGDEALVTPGDTLDEALVPWDAMDIHDPAQLVIDDQIGNWLKALGTTNVTLIIDGCFSGTATRGAEIAPVARPRAAPGNIPSRAAAAAVDVVDNPGYALITASSATDVAMELPLGQDKKVFGVLTYYLTEALDAAGSSSRFDEVMRDVTANVRAERELEPRSEEHTSELQSPYDLVCRLLLEKKKWTDARTSRTPAPARSPARSPPREASPSPARSRAGPREPVGGSRASAPPPPPL